MFIKTLLIISPRPSEQSHKDDQINKRAPRLSHMSFNFDKGVILKEIRVTSRAFTNALHRQFRNLSSNQDITEVNSNAK